MPPFQIKKKLILVSRKAKEPINKSFDCILKETIKLILKGFSLSRILEGIKFLNSYILPQTCGQVLFLNKIDIFKSLYIVHYKNEYFLNNFIATFFLFYVDNSNAFFYENVIEFKILNFIL